MDAEEERAHLVAWHARKSAGEPIAAELEADVDAILASARERVYRWLRARIGEQEALDLTHDTLVTGVEKLGTWEGSGRFVTWLVGIANLKLANRRRKATEQLDLEGAVPEPEISEHLVTGLQRARRSEVLARACAEALTPEQQVLYRLKFVEGANNTVIAEELGLDGPKAVKLALQNIRRRLARALDALARREGYDAEAFFGSLELGPREDEPDDPS